MVQLYVMEYIIVNLLLSNLFLLTNIFILSLSYFKTRLNCPFDLFIKVLKAFLSIMRTRKTTFEFPSHWLIGNVMELRLQPTAVGFLHNYNYKWTVSWYFQAYIIINQRKNNVFKTNSHHDVTNLIYTL